MLFPRLFSPVRLRPALSATRYGTFSGFHPLHGASPASGRQLPAHARLGPAAHDGRARANRVAAAGTRRVAPGDGRGRLPRGVTPSLGPDATGVGWVYQYAVLGAQRTLPFPPVTGRFVRVQLAGTGILSLAVTLPLLPVSSAATLPVTGPVLNQPLSPVAGGTVGIGSVNAPFAPAPAFNWTQANPSFAPVAAAARPSRWMTHHSPATSLSTAPSASTSTLFSPTTSVSK